MAGYRALIWAAVAVLLSCPMVLAQEAGQPVAIGEANSPTENGEVAADPNAQGSGETPTANDITPALDRIASAIRDIKTQEGESERQEAAARNNRDLAAQEDMALWAMWMFIATTVTAILTAAALWLIYRTVHHTKRAADYAGKMVDEAKATTAAAIETIKLTADQFDHARSLDRPWVYVHVMKGLKPIPEYIGSQEEFGCVQFSIHNHGRTPAAITEWREYVGYGKSPGNPLFNESRCLSIGAGASIEGLLHDFPATIGGTVINIAEEKNEPIPAKHQAGRLFSLFILEYRGPTGSTYEAGFCFVYDHAIGGWRPHYGVPADKYNYHREKAAD